MIAAVLDAAVLDAAVLCVARKVFCCACVCCVAEGRLALIVVRETDPTRNQQAASAALS